MNYDNDLAEIQSDISELLGIIADPSSFGHTSASNEASSALSDGIKSVVRM